jgi:hypothetical protein
LFFSVLTVQGMFRNLVILMAPYFFSCP